MAPYMNVSLQIIIIPPRHAVKMPLEYIWVDSEKKMKIVISSSDIIVIYAKEIRMATSQLCDIRQVPLRSSDQTRYSSTHASKPGLLRRDNLVN